MKLRKNIAKGLVLGTIITNLPTYSFADNLKNDFYNEISNIETKEDLQKSAQKAVKSGEVDTWIEGLANMPTKRDSFASAVVDGKIYCIGGSGGSSYYNKVEVYDPATDTWETKAGMPTSRYRITSAVVDGKIYCIGGYNNSTYLNKVEVYDPATDTWETKANMPTGRYNLTSAVVDDKIYCIGGTGSSSYSNKVEVYDPATDTWKTKANMSTGRYALTSAVVDGKIYCIGGTGSSSYYLNKVEVYDPATDTWETKTSMPTGRDGLTSTVVDDKIYCIGGYNGSYSNKVEVYDPATDTWDTKANMPTGRSYLASAVVDGKIYCIGGNSGSYSNKVEAYIAITPEKLLESNSQKAVEKAESSLDSTDVEEARGLVNQLPEGELKSKLQARLDAIFANVKESPTANIDIYVKGENAISVTLDTNNVTFENFTGIEDVVQENAVNMTVSSSLPYQINAYLVDEIQNANKSKTMDKEILNIKENGESDYQTFKNVGEAIILKDNCSAGNDLTHGIDFKLKGGLLYEQSIYKTVIKFEVKQK